METILIEYVLEYSISALVGLGVAIGAIKMKLATLNDQLAKAHEERLVVERSLNGRLEKLETELIHHKTATTDRLARIETKLDLLLTYTPIIKG